ncbi:MAG: hypothetical protein GX326_01570 [Clostridiaceae bacterium]|nr:hypothetical protein [Clostridiaceae bacterium]
MTNYERKIHNSKSNVDWSFDQAIEFLASAKRLSKRPGLPRLKELLTRLGNPHFACPVIHVAGTNGKSTVCSMIAFIAAEAGKKVGLFTSPYLKNITEKIRMLDGKSGLQQVFEDSRAVEISEQNFTNIMAVIAFEIEVMKAKGYGIPSEEEILIAAAFIYYAEMECDLLILETGMGGIMDATNITTNKIATIITALSYDHVEPMGKDITEIAKEKTGIIQKDVPTFLYDPFDTVLSEEDAAKVTDVFIKETNKLNSPLKIVKRSNLEIISSYLSGQSFKYKDLGPFTIQFGGDYQAQNAALAIEGSMLFTDTHTIENGLALARWPGRLESVTKDPYVLIDGAHNQQGVLGLKKHLEKFFAGQKIIVLMDALKGKNFHEMIETFLSSNLYSVSQIICTESDFEKKLSAKKFAKKVQKIKAKGKSKENLEMLQIDENLLKCCVKINDKIILYSDDRKLATKYAYKLAVENNVPLIVFGSQYLIGNVRSGLYDLSKGKEI